MAAVLGGVQLPANPAFGRRRWPGDAGDGYGPTVVGVEAYPQLALKAAALLESVVRSHPLIDGDKRTALTLMVQLLWINGYRRDFNTDDAFDPVVGVAAGNIDLQRSAALIEKHLIRR
ncbi:Fic family protein [Arthrobacter sp. B2a2-09]|uniref:Fic family protein n=1 Tax=Arthrobacter sp. B2a2-09 TaxID=2952822 RepID=UPI0022CDB158|nr:Fic family protein [Arthrobacter sp. B2a2-09]MCZ9881673.1 Fic family protein [Arthrobacter sp. B2a2-09]